MVIAVVGAGGKTTLIKKLAQKYRADGKKVFVTTSTHMFIEENTLVTDDADVILQELAHKKYVMAGSMDGVKIKALSEETYRKVCEQSDVVLVEADGSKHLPLKFPREDEPVIYDNADEIMVVCGLHGLGKKADEVVHCFDLAQEYMQIEENVIVTPQLVQQLVMKGYVEPLRRLYPDKKISIVPMDDGSLFQRALAEMIKSEQDVSLLKEEWFCEQPTLVICGAGHVSCELVKMASYLDFTIKVIDDRAEFANKERFPMADEVIVDSFEKLENHLERNAYYVVVTRGHKDDFECVKKILNSKYRYLGMIGSKLKVTKTFEDLKNAGVPQEQINRIFAPIGLNINAVTPAEIAVSILAQIIMEKNQKHIASVSRELLQTRENGVLCIIIEKSGSSPRGVGSMMFVTEKNVYDSIGGGAVEFAVIEDAKKCKHIMIKEYQLNNKDSAQLGMICGGNNVILFIPIVRTER